jgi:hypothetical protein
MARRAEGCEHITPARRRLGEDTPGGESERRRCMLLTLSNCPHPYIAPFQTPHGVVVVSWGAKRAAPAVASCSGVMDALYSTALITSPLAETHHHHHY